MLLIIDETVELSKEDVEKCKTHATEFADSRIYKDSLQVNTEKIKLDAFNGKLAEFAVYRRLLLNGFNCLPPDTNIYSENNRSWKHDLEAKLEAKPSIKISVKSCDKNSHSWVFQADFSGRYDKSIFDCSENHIIYLTEILSDNLVNIFAALSAKKAIGLMRLPRLRRLFGLKLCIYKSDL